MHKASEASFTSDACPLHTPKPYSNYFCNAVMESHGLERREVWSISGLQLHLCKSTTTLVIMLKIIVLVLLVGTVKIMTKDSYNL